MNRLSVLIAVALVCASACDEAPNKPKPQAAEPVQEPAPETVSELSRVDYMTHLIEHNAMEIWDRQMIVSDADGSRSTEPRTAEEWEEAESFALTLVQLTYPLHKPGLAVDAPGWDAGIERLRDAARSVAVAAESNDVKGWYEAADNLDVACVECHYKFAPHLEELP